MRDGAESGPAERSAVAELERLLARDPRSSSPATRRRRSPPATPSSPTRCCRSSTAWWARCCACTSTTPCGQDAAVQAERAAGRLADAREVAVAFADLTGFTALGDQAGLEEVGALAGRFEALAAEATVAPARLVKVLGDGAMYVGRDPAALLQTVLGLMTAAAEQGLPAVHAGAAQGPAVRSAGDWFGHTVNLASRLCDAAAPGTALVAAALADAAEAEGLAAGDAAPLRLRGIEAPVAARQPRPREG